MKLLRSPIVHFLLLGAVLFIAAAGWRQPSDDGKRIVVTTDKVAQLTADFRRVHRRPPSPVEMDGLTRNYVREEAAYREAMALGLDRDDPVIRNRLREKMEFLFGKVAALTEPSDAQLTAYLQAHPDGFRIPPRYSFEQIYLDARRRPERRARDVDRLLVQLNAAAADAVVAAIGDPFVLDHRFAETPADEVRALFGPEFAAALSSVQPGRWQGPIASAYGLHLVRVSERTAGEIPPLAEIRDAVRREWMTAAQQRVEDELYAGLLERYPVVVERP